MSIKPEMQLAGMDGNIFNILGAASKLLKENGLETQAKEMFERTTAATSYENALMIVSEYVQTELSESMGMAQTPVSHLSSEKYKQIYICAPLRSDIERNVETAWLFAKQVFEQGDIPITPHLLFPSIADPKNPDQDAKALAMCMKLIENCHQVNVYGQPTEGMKAEIEHARRMGIPVRESVSVKKKAKSKSFQYRSPGR